MNNIQEAIKQRMSILDAEKLKLTQMLEVYELPIQRNGMSKTEQYKHELKKLFQQNKSWHINDIEVELERRGLHFSKPLVHQCLASLRESGEVTAIRVNGSNQKYFYLSSSGRKGQGVKDEYLPMPKPYIESVEIKT